MLIITGALGFIGSCLVRYLNEKGRSDLILVDDPRKSEKWKNILGKSFIEVISRDALFDWLQGKEKEIDAIIHLGACSNTLETDGDYLLENNYRYSIRLAEYAMKNDKRFIYASSAATYGNGEEGFSDHHDLLESLYPVSLYGFSKHLFDLWLKRQNLLSKVVGLKYFNVFGPNEYHKGAMASMIYKMTKKIQNEGKLSLFRSSDPRFADGEQKRDFIYVKDAVSMTARFLEEKINGIFNIGRGEAISWNRIAKALFKALQKKPNIEYIDMPSQMVGQYQNFTEADMTKYNRAHHLEGNLPPTMGIEEAVEDYVQNYLLKDARW